jgi:glycosyltransferase involved in cell wall biosynthesis
VKVLYVLCTAYGGIPHYAAQLANAVSRYASVIVLKPEKTSADELFSSDVKVINAFTPIRLGFVDMYDVRGATNILLNFVKIFLYRDVSIVNKVNPDIIHFPDFPPQAQILASKIDKKYPKIVTLHGISDKKINIKISNPAMFFSSIAMSFWNLLSSSLLFKKEDLDRIIVHTQILRARLIRMGFNADKIKVIPHGAFDVFARTYRHGAGVEEENTILFFGNIVWSKGLDVLVEAMPLVIKEIPSVKLIIAGDGVIPKRSWQIIAKYKANFEVHNYFIPNEKVAYFFSRASLVVIPSRKQEGHSGVLTVAYSFGKPVVATNVGEFPVLVRDTGCGLVVPPEDPKALAEGIISLLRDERLRRRMGENALKMTEKLSWENIAKIHLKLYEEVLNERKGRS